MLNNILVTWLCKSEYFYELNYPHTFNESKFKNVNVVWGLELFNVLRVQIQRAQAILANSEHLLTNKTTTRTQCMVC